jgi:hypothetical protein
MTVFGYKGQLDANSIRLVRICAPSAHSDERIQLEIADYQLISLPPYRALSYTWGPPRHGTVAYSINDKSTIRLNGDDFDVFPNLLDVLHHLRGLGASQLYWIDAICINQDDRKEREVQVGMMDKIYRSADRTDIWVGKLETHTAELGQLVSRIAQASRELKVEFEKGDQAILINYSPEQVTEKYGLPSWEDDIWETFVDFFDRSWFQRVWVFQEVALAKDAAFLSGSGEISVDDVHACGTFNSRHNLYRILRPKFPGQRGSFGEWRGLGDTVPGMRETKAHFQVANEDLALAKLGLAGAGKWTMGHFLLDMLMKTRSLQATDARDKIFGILGIMSLIADLHSLSRLNLEPNYSDRSTLSTILTNTTRIILEGCQHLGFLTFVDEATRMAKDVPSWVPDITVRGYSTITAERFAKQYKIMRDEKPPEIFGPLNFRVVDTSLHVHASLLGTVSHISESCDDMLNHGSFEQCARLLLESEPTYKQTGQGRVEVLWRTMLHDLDADYATARPGWGSHFGSWLVNSVFRAMLEHKAAGGDADEYLAGLRHMDSLATSDSTGTIPSIQSLQQLGRTFAYIQDENHVYDVEEARPLYVNMYQGYHAFQRASNVLIRRRRVFLTTEGHIGLSTEPTMVGDDIWSVSGCPTPVVLRRDANDDVALRYKLLGEAYVHGIMRGQNIGNDVQWEEVILI